MTPTAVQASFVAGYPPVVTLAAKQRVPFAGVVYIQVHADQPVVESPVTIKTNADDTFSLSFTPLAGLAVGHYAGNFAVNVCTDVNCSSPLEGAPFQVPYDFTAISPDGDLIAYNLSPLSALAGGSDWGTFQGNAGHTGFVPVTLHASAFNARWKWDASAYGGVQWSPSALTTGAGMFYVSSGPYWSGSGTGHELFAYKEDDGSKVWSHSFADLTYASTNPPAFSGGKVFMSAGSQSSTSMFAFDAATGTQVFKSQMASQWEHYFAPTIFNGAVYTDGGSYGGMYAFDTTTGAQDFFAGGRQFDGWTPAVDATRAYVYTGNTLTTYDSRTGAQIASIADPNTSNAYAVSSPVLGAANTVYAGGLSNRSTNAIVNFDTLNNAVRWSVTGAFPGHPAYNAGSLFAANNAPFELDAFNEADGSKLWTWTPPAGNGNFVGDVLATSNLVFVSTDTNTYAIDRGTHQPVWSYAASGSLALSANGVLYIRNTYSIVAINLQ